jgi:hypothetical protein
MYETGDCIKTEFRDAPSGQVEWMWVRVQHDDPASRVVFRVLDSEPIVNTDLYLGQELAVSCDMIRERRTPASFNPV